MDAARRAARVFLGFTAFYTLFFSPILFGSRLLATGHDAYLYHYPALFGGRALWDPLLFSGYPRLADPQVMLWYPLALPLSLSGWEALWNPFLLAAYVLASCFTYGLVWRSTRCAAAAILSGLVYGLSGFLLAHQHHVAVLHGAAWLPLLLWSLHELRDGFQRGWLAVLAVAVACCFLAGHVQVFVLALALGGLYTAWHLRSCRQGLTAGAGVVLGLALAGVQLLPTAELVPQSSRARLSFADCSTFPLPRRQLPQLVFPFAYGGGEAGPYAGEWNFEETTGYCGLVSLVLAGVGFLAGLRGRSAWFWGLAAVTGVALALGRATPLARALYHVPVLNCFRCPGRYLLWFDLAIAVLAGKGVLALLYLPRRRAALVLLAASAVVLAEVGAAWWAVARHAAVGQGLAVLLGGLLLLWAAWYARPGRWAALLLLAAVGVDAGLFGWFSGWRSSPVRAGILARVPEPIAGLRHDLRSSGERLLALSPLTLPAQHAREYPRALHLDAAPVNLSAWWGVPNGLGYTPLALKRYADLLSDTGPPLGGTSEDLLAIRYFLCPADSRAGDHWHLRGTLADGSHRILENRRPLRRAWLASNVVRAPAEDIVNSIRSGQLPDGSPFEPYRTALVEEEVPLSRGAGWQPAGAEDTGWQPVLRQDGPHRVRVACRSSREALLVLGDVYYPGWKVWVDGRPARLYRVDHVLRGVVVPPGSHRVEFRFRPASLVAGLSVSTAAVGVLLALVLGPPSRFLRFSFHFPCIRAVT